MKTDKKKTNLNRPETIKQIELETSKLYTKKTPGLGDKTGKMVKCNELIPIPINTNSSQILSKNRRVRNTSQFFL